MSRSLYAQLARRYGPRVDALSRREMLKATLLASAGLLLSGSPVEAFWQERKSGKRVIVVGGGFGGLACAHELKAAGYDVTVVEARNRVGGRVLSFSDLIKDRNVEGGGELIGSNHPTWVAYAQKFGLEFLDVTEDEGAEAPLILGGKKISAEDAEKLYQEMTETQASMNADAAAVNEDEPWKTPDAEKLDRRSTADWIASLKCSDLAKTALRAELNGNNGQDVAKQSYLGNLTQVKGGGLEKYWTESEVYRCKGGNQQLATKLAESVGAARIILKLPVTRVRVNDAGVTVTCGDGRTIEADDIVIATPPSTWGKVQFDPDLPAGLKPQMGTNVKYLSVVKKRFWKDAKLSPDAATDGEISMTWDGTDNQPDDAGACLTSFSGGPAAEKIRTHPKEQVEKVYRKLLEELYPGFNDFFVSGRFMDWPSEPFTMAGYSFPAPGQITSVGPLLRKGMPRVHFAGEHTCYKFVGYMEGALNSGVSVAKRIAERDGVKVG